MPASQAAGPREPLSLAGARREMVAGHSRYSEQSSSRRGSESSGRSLRSPRRMFMRFARPSASRFFMFFLVAMPERPHPFPSRTRKLSSPGPMVLQGRPCGRVGCRRGFFEGLDSRRDPRFVFGLDERRDPRFVFGRAVLATTPRIGTARLRCRACSDSCARTAADPTRRAGRSRRAPRG
jgi:hypothetical protein